VPQGLHTYNAGASDPSLSARRHPQQGIPEMTRAVADQGVSAMYGASQVPRSSTFASKAMPSGAMSPTLAAQGAGFNQRSSSFSVGAAQPTYTGQQHSSLSYHPLLGSQRAASPTRPSIAPGVGASPYSGHSLQAPLPMQSRGGQCGMASPAPAHGHPLEVTSRMARATELQHRLSGQPPPQTQTPQPLPFPIGTPSLLSWAKEHQQSGRFSASTPGPGFGRAGSYSAQGHDAGDPMGLGLGTLHNLPPPPRSAPAAESGGGGPGPASAAKEPVHSLTVLTSDNRWETIAFSASDNLDSKGASFLRQKGLKAAFQSGLTSKMRTMIAQGQAQSSVDIVDLI